MNPTLIRLLAAAAGYYAAKKYLKAGGALAPVVGGAVGFYVGGMVAPQVIAMLAPKGAAGVKEAQAAVARVEQGGEM